MKSYYQDSLVTIYHGDCRDWDGSADVVITDPPYNVGVAYGDATNDRRTDYAEWCESWFVPLRKRTHAIALTPGFPNLATWCQIEPPTWVIAGLKPAAMGRSPFGFCNWEPVFFWGQPGTRASTDVFTAPIVPDGFLNHPCPKPLKWATSLVTLVAGPVDIVLDPFAGTGTTLVAAKSLNRPSIGIEIEERYCEIAAQRCSQEVLGLAL